MVLKDQWAELKAPTDIDLIVPNHGQAFLRFRLDSDSHHRLLRTELGHETRTCTGACHWLELGGTAVRQDFPSEQKRLEVPEGGLVVGRSQQTALHAEAIHPEASSHISREQFHVGFKGSALTIRALGGHGMWLQRGIDRFELERGGPELDLVVGDTICLYTGASHVPFGPGNHGTVTWTLCGPSPLDDTLGRHLGCTEEAGASTYGQAASHTEASRARSTSPMQRYTSASLPMPDLSQAWGFSSMANETETKARGSFRLGPRRSKRSTSPSRRRTRSTPPTTEMVPPPCLPSIPTASAQAWAPQSNQCAANCSAFGCQTSSGFQIPIHAATQGDLNAQGFQVTMPNLVSHDMVGKSFYYR